MSHAAAIVLRRLRATRPGGVLASIQGRMRRIRNARVVGLDEGAKRLMFAVLEDALLIVTCDRPTVTGRGARRTRETLEWIFADDRDYPFSFVNVCEALDVSVERLRASIPASPPHHAR